MNTLGEGCRLTESTDEQGDQVPCPVFEQLIEMKKRSCRKQNNENDGSNETGIVPVKDESIRIINVGNCWNHVVDENSRSNRSV